MQIEHLEWKDSYSVNDPDLDSEHKHFAEVANEIIDLAQSPDVSKEAMLLKLTELGNLIFLHFDKEEVYLKQLHFPEAEEHIKKHAEHRKSLKAFLANVCDKDCSVDTLNERVVEFVTDWFTNHMMGNAGTEQFFAEKRKESGV